MYELKKNLGRYLRVNLLGPGPRLVNKVFTGTRSDKGSEKLPYITISFSRFCYEYYIRPKSSDTYCISLLKSP